MCNSLDELAAMIARRDNTSIEEAWSAINYASAEMEQAFYSGDLDLVEDILRADLGLEPDYLDLFIF